LVVVQIDEKGRPRIDWDLSKSMRDNEKPKAEEPDEGIELSDELMDVLEANAAVFVDLTPVGLQQFLDEGGDLETLDGMTPELAQELRDSLAARLPDLSKLLESGLSDDLIEKLADNVKGTDSEWLLDHFGQQFDDLDEAAENGHPLRLPPASNLTPERRSEIVKNAENVHRHRSSTCSGAACPLPPCERNAIRPP
jgi:hypothetical protein